jgi:SAM-dependent methyltransferase
VAASLASLFKGPDGWKIEPEWWKRTPAEFGDQLEMCEYCSACLPVPRNVDALERDLVTPGMAEKLKQMGSKKPVTVVTDTWTDLRSNYLPGSSASPGTSVGDRIRVHSPTGLETGRIVGVVDRVLVGNTAEYEKEFDEVVLVDCPQSMETLRQTLLERTWVACVPASGYVAPGTGAALRKLILNPGATYTTETGLSVFNTSGSVAIHGPGRRVQLELPVYRVPSFCATMNQHPQIPHNHWEVRWITDLIDRRVPLGGTYNWLRSLQRTPGKAVSIGCGQAHKEIALLQAGLATGVEAYDLDEVALAIARQKRDKAGLGKQLQLLWQDGCSVMLDRTPRYDLVHWDCSLHHFEDVVAAVKWSWDVLLPGGVFYLHEYVGADRFQWSEAELTEINRIRESFPERWFGQGEASWHNQRKLPRTPLESLSLDEAPTSSRILAAAQTHIPGFQWKALGGLGYYGAMTCLWSESTTSADAPFLLEMMEKDRACSDSGLFCYAVGMAVKSQECADHSATAAPDPAPPQEETLL